MIKELCRTIKAFLVRDALMQVSYRLDFFLKVLSILLTVLALYFVSRLIGENAAFDEYGGYLPFAIIGLSLMSYFHTGFKGFSNAIRTEQMMGTLEAILMTPTRVSSLVIASSMWSFFWATANAVIYILAASMLYDIHLKGSIFTAALVLLLTTLTFSSMGIISASIIMVFKRGDPMGMCIGAISLLLGGVFYPVQELPSWLQNVSALLPITHGVEGLRRILLKGEAISSILPQIIILLGFAIIFIPLSLFCFKKAVHRAQREGTLLQY